MRIAVVGGGVAGLTAAWQLKQSLPELAGAGRELQVSLFEASNRLGGIIQTVREGGFILETGPDGWVSQKPWATDLARELGLQDELIGSRDESRRVWMYLSTPEHPTPRLVPVPDHMTLMVPSDLAALEGSSLLSAEAIRAYRSEPERAEELLKSSPSADESVASFTLRHFGPEVLERIAAPLLSGVFGGDVWQLSAQAALPGLVELERRYGSLILGVQAQREESRRRARESNTDELPLFTSLRSGVGMLVERLIAAIPQQWIRINTSVVAIQKDDAEPGRWRLTSSAGARRTTETFDHVFFAVSSQAVRGLLAHVHEPAAELLPQQASSAVLVSYAFPDAHAVPLPPGFGLLVPRVTTSESPERPVLLQACTFSDQKFESRVPAGGRQLRAFFGGAAALRLANCNNDEIAAIGRFELARVLHTYTHGSSLAGPPPKPLPDPVVTVVRRLPESLPQYTVGHLERARRLTSLLSSELRGITLLGNSLHGLGISDVIREARNGAREATGLARTP